MREDRGASLASVLVQLTETLGACVLCRRGVYPAEQGRSVAPKARERRYREEAHQPYVTRCAADKASFLALVVTDAVWTTKDGWIPITALADGTRAVQVEHVAIVNPNVTCSLRITSSGKSFDSLRAAKSISGSVVKTKHRSRN